MFTRLPAKVLVACATLVLLGTGPSRAVTYGFDKLSSNSSADVSGQLFLDVTDSGGGQALFTFRNDGPTASFVNEIYFDDGTLLGIASLDESGGTVAGGGVDYEDATGNVSPPNAPGANLFDPDFVATQAFSVEAESPGSNKDGIDPGEWLGILFSLQGGTTFADLINAIAAGLALGPNDDPLGTLRIALHVQGQGTDGESDLYGLTAIPLPAALPLFGAALGGLGLLSWRRKRRIAATA
jgi:hypothetical protein